MKHLLFICVVLTGLNLACQPEEEIISGDAVRLQFEKDTVQFDTLFTSEQSVTKRLRIYNPSAKAVLIESIRLQGGSASPYTLYVNGRPGRQFGEQELLGRDSLLLLLEARLPVTTDVEPYIASDVLLISNKGLQQELPVVGYGQNASFIKGQEVECNTIWDSPLPYVIEESVLVDTLCTLTIAKGSRLYFKPGATLYVKGSLIAEGDSIQADRILFRNHRLEPFYENQPGQWGGIVFLPGSRNNRLSYCSIRNAEYGVYLGTPDEDEEADLVLKNCRIENTLYGGIVSYTSDLVAVNTLVNTSAGYTVANMAGGSYSYLHCTFANFFNQREGVPTLLFSDYEVPAENTEVSGRLQISLRNCIVWGNLGGGNEVVLNIKDPSRLSLLASHNLLRTNESLWEGNGNILGTELYLPKFINSSLYNYRPDSLSPAVNAGEQLDTGYDLEGRKRDEKPDIGALEYYPEAGEE